MLFETEILTLCFYPVQQLSSIVGYLHALIPRGDERLLRRFRERNEFSDLIAQHFRKYINPEVIAFYS
ncbi:hypothetical protein PM8797T_31383 [Gimesia maris DSM 8797]|nr:hypothetical protein PM8797T_31383 [Gimesia maris DSM 8797]